MTKIIFSVKTKTYPESTHKNVPKNIPTDIVARKVKFMTHPTEYAKYGPFKCRIKHILLSHTANIINHIVNHCTTYLHSVCLTLVYLVKH